MKDTTTTRVIAGIYIALCAGLSREGARLANDCLLEFSSDPKAGLTKRFFIVNWRKARNAQIIVEWRCAEFLLAGRLAYVRRCSRHSALTQRHA